MNENLPRNAITMNAVADDYSSDDSGAGQLAPGSQLGGQLQFGGDSDRFKLSMEVGKYYKVAVSAAITGNISQMLMQAYDDSGVRLYALGAALSGGTTTYVFSPAKSGLFSLDLSGNTGSVIPGAYTIKALPALSDDYGSTMASAAALALNSQIAAVLEAPADQDMVKVVLEAGVTYGFETQVSGAGYKGVSMTMLLTDGAGNALASNAYGSKYMSWTPAQTATYYLTASGTNYSALDYVPYTLKVSPAADDYGANAATAGKLELGVKTAGVLDAGGGDRDWFAVTLEAGSSYWFTLSGVLQNDGTLWIGALTSKLRVLDASGNPVQQGSYDATAPVLPFVAPAKGTYYVEVSAPANNAGSYQLLAQAAPTDDYGNDVAHAAPIGNGVAVNGKLEMAVDKDVFKLSAIAGTTYAIEVKPGAGGGYGTAGMSLGIAGSTPGMPQLRQLPATGGKLYALFDAATTADYFITLAGTQFITPSGSYTVSVTAQPADDYPANATTTALLTPAAPLQGVIGWFDDSDWVKVHMEAGKTYLFDLQGAASGGGTLLTADVQAGLILYAAPGTGNYIASSALAGVLSEPRLSYAATATGDYYLSAYGNRLQSGSYTLHETITNSDIVQPYLKAYSIPSGAVNVALNAKPALTFTDELILLNGSAITLRDKNGLVVVPAGQVLASVVGQTLVIDPHQNLKPGTTYMLDLPRGSVMDLAGNHFNGYSYYQFTTRAAVATGGEGNDYLMGSGKGLTLNGGAGIDTAYYDDSQGALQVTRSAGKVTVQAAATAAGDILIGVERLLFPTHALALDIDGNGGQTYRLYQAAFNRAPDSVGLGFWIAAMDNKTSLHAVAQGFVDSAEFKSLYGAAPSDADFVTLLYNNVLHRAPDQAGTDFWVQGLHDGASRADILANFSESPENQSALLKVIGNGFAYTPYG